MSTDRYEPRLGDWVIATTVDQRFTNLAEGDPIQAELRIMGQVERIDTVSETAQVYAPDFPVPGWRKLDAAEYVRLRHPWFNWRDLRLADERAAVFTAQRIIGTAHGTLRQPAVMVEGPAFLDILERADIGIDDDLVLRAPRRSTRRHRRFWDWLWWLLGR